MTAMHYTGENTAGLFISLQLFLLTAMALGIMYFIFWGAQH